MNDQYRVFQTEDEVEKWAEKWFSDLYGKALNEDEDFDELYLYGGNNYTPINRSLRNRTSIDEEIDHQIEHLTDILSRHYVPEPIVVFRYTTKKAVRSLSGKHIIRKGLCFTDKAFVSTSLLLNAIIEFGNQNHCNCLLKINVPEGTNGAYISYEKTDSKLRERELLLQRNLEFEITKVHFFSRPLLIECQVKKNGVEE